MLQKIIKALVLTGLILFCSAVLIFSLRGIYGTPNSHELNTLTWKDNGPLELSPERGRYALLYSVIEDKSFQFSESIGHFARPDVAMTNGRYVSLFAPGVSYVIIPGYILGKIINLGQVGSFAVIALFGLINMFLIRAITIKLGANSWAASLAGLTYLFATPAYSYAVNLYQHQLSTFLILISIFSLLYMKPFWALIIVFLAFGSAIPIDNPNLVLLAPIGIVGLTKIINIDQTKNFLRLRFYILRFLTGFFVFIPIALFLWSNYVSYGNPYQLAGTLPTAPLNAPTDTSNELTISKIQNELAAAKLQEEQFEESTKEVKKEKSAVGFFKTRNLLNGFYTHFISQDRGILFFTPIMFLGFIGIWLAYKKKVQYLSMFVGIIGLTILLYSMWGDPYGGWAFGSRYLIPAYAILSIFIGLLLTYWKKYWIFLFIFTSLFIYSVAVNTLGAITTSANPPKIEAVALSEKYGVVQKYSYDRNYQYLVDNKSKSFVYGQFLKDYLSAWQFYLLISTLISLVGVSLLISLRFSKEENYV